MSYTPGPWTVYWPWADGRFGATMKDWLIHDNSSPTNKTLIDGKTLLPQGRALADAKGCSTLSNEERNANACLIAAAPELLEALKAVQEHINWLGIPSGYSSKDFTDLFEQISTAIAKAEGRS